MLLDVVPFKRKGVIHMAQIQRTAEAVWEGDSRNGGGKVSTGSGAIRDQVYTWRMRFEDEPGTNPDELIAAALAACFNMSLAAGLSKAGFVPNSLHTRAALVMEQEGGGWSVTRIHLEVDANVPNIDEAAFQQSATQAKDNCPISRLLTPGLKGIDLVATLKK
jgi:osmotically inducible protein OsmC